MRKIIHIDMDAFYAAIEQRDNPAYRGRPVVVGGTPQGRGVVATASYEARAFGIHSAMPSSKAYRLCPSAIFLPPRMDIYRTVSKQIHSIFYHYTDLVESLGLDEAYLDVTRNKLDIPSASWVASKLRNDVITQTGLTASAGVSYNKFLAKLASDINKPNGMKVITPEESQQFIDNLPIGRFHGIGKAIEARMLKLGILTGMDLRRLPEAELVKYFGKNGIFYFQISRGQDDRPVSPYRDRKSVGAERTFSRDLKRPLDMHDVLKSICATVAKRLTAINAAGKTITLKVRYANFETITRSKTLGRYVNELDEIWNIVKELLGVTEAGNRSVRLFGVSVSGLNLNQRHKMEYQPELPFSA